MQTHVYHAPANGFACLKNGRWETEIIYTHLAFISGFPSEMSLMPDMSPEKSAQNNIAEPPCFHSITASYKKCMAAYPRREL
jgi:hypothetical protein